MLLEIRHVTEYHYAEAVRESVMELWMQPRKGGGQRLISFELTTNPASRLFSYPDAFGNAVYHFDVPPPHDRLHIEARSAVETAPLTEIPQALDMGEWDRLKSDFVRGECFDFLRPHGFVEYTGALQAFIAERGVDKLRALDPLSAVQALNKAVYEAFEYDASATAADSPMDLVLKHGRGVCQDFAHVMLAVCRSWGVPARYVSGYLFNDRSEGDRSDPDATHAWIEVFLPSLRWVGLDPTNNLFAGERHVAVAIGRDYGDVPPSRGVYKGDTDSELVVGVSIHRAKSAPAEPEFTRLNRPAFTTPGRRREAIEDLLRRQQQQQQQ